jgi:hypothetical protein
MQIECDCINYEIHSVVDASAYVGQSMHEEIEVA